MAHHPLADVRGRNFLLPPRHDFFFEGLSGSVDFFHRNRSLLAGLSHSFDDFTSIERFASPILFHYHGKGPLHPFVGGESKMASGTHPAAANRIPFWHSSGIYHFAIGLLAVGALHGGSQSRQSDSRHSFPPAILDLTTA